MVLRPVMEAAYGDLARGRVPVVVAPTGYGKTRASPEIYRRAVSEGIASGLVHVVPLRSLVRKIYMETFRGHGGAYQMLDPSPGPDKSPYLLRPLVVTTLDSFTYNLFRLPVLESLKIREGLSYGHYYPVYTSVLSSVVVFDEAHLYLSDEAWTRGMIVETLQALTRFLAKTGTSMIVETATMRPSTLSRIAGAAASSGRDVTVRILSCPRETPYEARLRELLGRNPALRGRVEIAGVPDQEWAQANQGLNWDTRIYRGWEEALREAKRLAGDGRVLVVANTVRRAIEIHKELGGESILIHGRLTVRDRERVENLLGSGGEPGVVVSTQVIEAGVDVNSIAVITEAAPIENLVQRAGRACRRDEALGWCRENGGLLGIVHDPDAEASTIYDPGEVEAAVELVAEKLSSGKGVDWRYPCQTGRDVVPYTSLIAEADEKTASTPRKVGASSQHLLEVFLEHDGVPDFVGSIQELTGWCGLVRNTIMMPIRVGRDYVITSLLWALSHAEEILELDEQTGAPILVGIPPEGLDEARGPAERLWNTYKKGNWGAEHNCYRLLKSLAIDQRMIARGAGRGVTVYRWALEARPGVYEGQVGFLVDSQPVGGGV